MGARRISKMEASFSAFLLLFCALFSSQTVALKDGPTIGFISPDVVLDIGGTVELVCTVKNGHEYPILWMRLKSEENNNPLPISTGPNLFLRDDRFKLDYDPNAGSYKLTIKDVVKSDEGRYQCQVVTDVKNVITADVDLKVKVSPVMLNTTESVVNAEVGKSAELACEANGFPSPKISWERKDNTLLPSGDESITSPTLVIQKVQRQHRGNYVCTASNDVGSPQKRVLDLQVGFPPTIELPSPRIPQALHYEVEMECQIHAYPAPAIRRFNGNQSIHNNRQHYIEYFAKRDDFVVSILKIYSAYPEDFGKYTCDAGNRYGSATQHMELYSTEMPICPPLCGDTNLNSGMAHFPASYLFSMALALNTILN